MSQFNIDAAKIVFKKYFKTDPNLTSPIINPSSGFFNVNPIETSNFDIISPLIYVKFKDYKTCVLRQLHKYLIESMLQRIADNSTFRQVLKGPSGVGKSTSLLITAQIAKEMNILPFPIDAHLFVNTDIDLAAEQFLIKWRKTYETIHDDLNPKLKGNFNFDSLTTQNAVVTFLEIIQKLRIQSIIPVLFIVNDCNVFHHNHYIYQNGEFKNITHPFDNPIGFLFYRDICYFDISIGAVLFSYSSTFEVDSFSKYTCDHTEVIPFSSNEWIKLLDTDVNIYKLGNAEELGTFLGHLPGELRQLQKFYYSQSTSDDKASIKSEYLRDAKSRFYTQIEKVFQHSNNNSTAVIGLKLLLELDVFDLNPIWYSSGLCAENQLADQFGYRFLCPAVRLAYRDFLRDTNKDTKE